MAVFDGHLKCTRCRDKGVGDDLCADPTTFNPHQQREKEDCFLLRNQFVKPPRSSRWYDMHADKKDSGRSTVCSWCPELAKLNSAFSRVARCNLPTATPSRALNQDILRHWERAVCYVQPGCRVVKVSY